MNVFSRGLRNAFRNSVRSVGIIAILALSIGLSIAMLLAHQAVNTKIASVRATTGTSVTVSPAGFFGFQGGGTPLTSGQLAPITSIPHVVGITESLSERLDSSQTSLQSAITPGSLGQQFGGGGGGGGFGGGSPGGSFTLPVRVTGTTTPGTALTGGVGGASTEKLVAGSIFSPTTTADVAIVGQGLASKNSLSVGSTFTAWGSTIKVVGIYDAGSVFANSSVLMPIKTVQTLSGSPDQVTSSTVTVDTVGNVATVQNEIKAKLGAAADVTSSQSQAETSLAPLNSVKTISVYALIAALAAAALITIFTMVMIVRERRREIGILKAIGAKGRSVVGQFMVEASVLTVIAAVVGLIFGILASNPIASTLVTNSTANASSGPGGFVRGGFGGGGGFSPPPGGFHGGPGGFFSRFHTGLTSIQTAAGWTTILFGIAAAIVLAAVASSVAAWSTSKIRPSEILRSE
jgi:putative ABC transport system permease protein